MFRSVYISRTTISTIRKNLKLHSANSDNFCVQMMFYPSGNPRNIMCCGPVQSDTRVVEQMVYLVAAIQASDSTLSTLEASKVLHKVIKKNGDLGLTDHGSIRFMFNTIADTYFLSVVDMSSTKEVED